MLNRLKWFVRLLLVAVILNWIEVSVSCVRLTLSRSVLIVMTLCFGVVRWAVSELPL